MTKWKLAHVGGAAILLGTTQLAFAASGDPPPPPGIRAQVDPRLGDVVLVPEGEAVVQYMITDRNLGHWRMPGALTLDGLPFDIAGWLAGEGLHVDVPSGPQRALLNQLVEAGLVPADSALGFDISPDIPRGPGLGRGSLYRLPLKPNSVARFFSLWGPLSYSQVPPARMDAGLREIARVLAPGGRAYVGPLKGAWGRADTQAILKAAGVRLKVGRLFSGSPGMGTTGQSWSIAELRKPHNFCSAMKAASNTSVGRALLADLAPKTYGGRLGTTLNAGGPRANVTATVAGLGAGFAGGVVDNVVTDAVGNNPAGDALGLTANFGTQATVLYAFGGVRLATSAFSVSAAPVTVGAHFFGEQLKADTARYETQIAGGRIPLPAPRRGQLISRSTAEDLTDYEKSGRWLSWLWGG